MKIIFLLDKYFNFVLVAEKNQNQNIKDQINSFTKIIL